MTAPEHATAIDGHCPSDCPACHVARLERQVERVRAKCEGIIVRQTFVLETSPYHSDRTLAAEALEIAGGILRELERGDT